MTNNNETNIDNTSEDHSHGVQNIKRRDITPHKPENPTSPEELEKIGASDLVRNEQQLPSPRMSEDAELPEAPQWLVDNIAEASKNTRSIYLLYLGFLAYCALTVVSTSDRQLILNEGASLPVIGVEVPFNIFIVAAPLLAIFIFCYLQLYLQSLKRLRVDLRENYAPIDGKRLYPWMINIAENPKQEVIGKLQRWAVQISLWWLLPAVLTLITYWFLKKHVPFWSYVMGLVPGIGAAIVLYFWSQYQVRGHWLWGKKARILMVGTVALFELYIMLFAIPRSLDGRRTLGGGFFLDLSYEILVTERKSEYDVPWLELRGVHLEGAFLHGSVLRNADLRFAHLERSDLSEAQMQGTFLGGTKLTGSSLEDAKLDSTRAWNTDLRNANLTGAQLSNAYLRGAKLDSADLSKADLQNTDLRNAQFGGANFSETNLQNVDLRNTRLDVADFWEPNLQSADLRDANLKHVGLWDSNLQGADLRNAKLDSASLRGSNLKNADLRKNRLVNVDLWETNLINAKLPARLDSVDLTQATLDSADLQGLNLKDAKLTQVRLRGANLSQAQLQGANLWGTRLNGANLSGAQLQDISFETPSSYASIENRPLPNTSRRVLCRAQTLYKAEMDSTVSERLKDSCPRVFTPPEYITQNVALRKLGPEASIFRARLDSVHLAFADLRNVALQEARLRNTNLYGANLNHADLRRARLQNARLNSAHLQNADLQGARLGDASIWEVNLKMADLRRAQINGAHLIEANLQNADLNHARLDSADLAHANLTNANLRNVQIDTANFFKTNLQGANLRGAQLGRAQFQEAVLKNVKLPTQLDSTIFTKAVLDSVNLQGVNLQSAKLTQVRLRGANLSEARLQGANLWGARLDDANFTGANLRDVSFAIPKTYANQTRPVPTKSHEILCAVKTLYDAKLNSLVSKELREHCPRVLAPPDSASVR
jgi:uncharacterized protein YjbI with pentapeptide repeats